MKHEYELAICPICKAKPWIYEDVQDLHIVCSEDCPAPNCAHTHPRNVAMAWNDWVRWYRTQMMEQAKSLYERAIAVDPDEALRMAMEAKDTEEKRFFTYIADMNLQRRSIEEFQACLAKKEIEHEQL